MKAIRNRANIIQALFLSLLIFGLNHSASADEQSPLENRVTIMQSSADGLIEDLEYMVKGLAKQGKIWRDYIEPNLEVFLDGVDSKKPVRIDLHFDEEQGKFYRFSFPYTDIDAFRNNLEASGLTSEPKARDLFQIGSAFDGWMKTKNKYAIFVPEFKKDLVKGKVADPTDDLKQLIEAGYDTAILINHDKLGIEQRKQQVKTIRTNLLSGIKKKSTESPAEYELRKLVAGNQLSQFEQYYVEVKYLEAGWITDNKNNEGKGNITLTALEGTELAGALKQIAEAKSKFVDVPETKDFVLSGRLLYPVVKSKQQQYETLYKAMLPVMLAKIEKKKDYSPEQKKAAGDAVEKVIAILTHELKLGVIDGFVEMRKTKQDDPHSLHELIAGIKVTQGQKVKEVLELLPEINSDIAVKIEAMTSGDLSIHEITLNKNMLPMIGYLFGTPCKIHLATSDEYLYISIGENGKTWLIETLEQISKSEEKLVPEFIRVKGHLKPFALALSKRDPMSELKEAVIATREKLIEAFDEKKYKSPEDYMEIIDKVEEGQVKGTMKIEPGYFRFIGLLIAEFAKNNL